jgi:hypothetical protein
MYTRVLRRKQQRVCTSEMPVYRGLSLSCTACTGPGEGGSGGCTLLITQPRLPRLHTHTQTHTVLDQG